MSGKLKPAAIIVALLALGVAGYAALNPAFAASCKSTWTRCADWTTRYAESAQASFKQSRFYASFQQALRHHGSLRQEREQAKAAAKAPPRKAPAPDLSPAAVRRRELASKTKGQLIAHSAFAQSGKSLGFSTEEQMAAHIDRVIDYAGPRDTKEISRSRIAYWDERTRSVVIVDPKNPSGGLMLKPNNGHNYFKDLK